MYHYKFDIVMKVVKENKYTFLTNYKVVYCQCTTQTKETMRSLTMGVRLIEGTAGEEVRENNMNRTTSGVYSVT
ncbi:hypothetical protein J6590_078196 [Homalodisca vitripennis]|nr:hypothetical protein J6590_078196 [Homalodisca vitripennis]